MLSSFKVVHSNKIYFNIKFNMDIVKCSKMFSKHKLYIFKHKIRILKCQYMLLNSCDICLQMECDLTIKGDVGRADYAK